VSFLALAIRAVLVLGYLCLPGLWVSFVQPEARASLSTAQVLWTAVLVAAVAAGAELIALASRAAARGLMVAAVQLLFGLRALEAGLVTVVGRDFDPLVIAHAGTDALGVALLDYATPIGGILVVISLASWPLFAGLRPEGRRRLLAAGAVLAAVLLLGRQGDSLRDGLASYRLLAAVRELSQERSFEMDLQPEELEILSDYGIRIEVGRRRPAIIRFPERLPNLVLVFLESFQANFSELGGSPFPGLVPNLDRFAQRFTYVENAFNAVTPTISAMVSMLCGVLPTVDLDVREGSTYGTTLHCLPDLLREAGYHQIYLGAAKKSFAGKGRFLSAHSYDRVFGHEDWMQLARYDGAPRTSWGIHDTDLVNEAITLLGALHRDSPFHLTLLTINTHMPGFLAPECPVYDPDNSYLQGIHCTDFAVGKLFAAMEEMGLLENTVVVLVGDHTTFPNPRAKRQLGEAVVGYWGRVFMAVHSPKRELPQRISTVTYSPDLAPTILDLMGFELDPGFAIGKSLLSERPKYQRLLGTEIEISGGRISVRDRQGLAQARCTEELVSSLRVPARKGLLQPCERVRLLSRVDRWLRLGETGGVSAEAAGQSRPRLLVAQAGGIVDVHAYSNSKQALNTNYAVGVRYFELDFEWTRDDRLVLIRDWGKTYKLYFGGRGKAPTLAKFKGLQMKAGLRQMALDDLYSWLRSHPHAYVVTKFKRKSMAGLRRIAETAGSLRERFIPQVYSPDEIRPLKELGYSKIILSLHKWRLSEEEILQLAADESVLAVTIRDSRAIKSSLVSDLADRGLLVCVRTVNSRRRWEELRLLGVSGIYTDALTPPRLRARWKPKATGADEKTEQ